MTVKESEFPHKITYDKSLRYRRDRGLRSYAQAFGIGDKVSQSPSSVSKISIIVRPKPPFFESYDSNCFGRSL